MSDPSETPHHGDEPPHYSTAAGGGFGIPPTGPPPQSMPGYGPHPTPRGFGAAEPEAPPGHPVPLTNDEMTWGGAAHWSALVASLIGLSFLGPLIVMLTKGNESPYIRAQAVESLNFQLSILIYGIVAAVLLLVLIGIILLPAVGLLWLICTIIGSVRGARGEAYRYPLTIRMVN